MIGQSDGVIPKTAGPLENDSGIATANSAIPKKTGIFQISQKLILRPKQDFLSS